MNQPDHDWKPDPQLLAAYFDGELEGRDDVADMCARIDAWLAAHPEAAQEWAAHQQLQKLWLDTTPTDPSRATWNKVLDRIDARRQRVAAPSSPRPWLIAGICAASIVLFIGMLFGAMRFLAPTPGAVDAVVQVPPKQPEPIDIDVLPVALASEVTILRIDGADTEAVVVGAMPVSGPLELADSGEVCISCQCPRVVVRQDPPHRPMVWARADVE